MTSRKHTIPLGTHVCFEGDSRIYEVGDHQTILECQPDCLEHHDDHWSEPHIAVREIKVIFKPLSELDYIFPEGESLGRKVTPEEKNGE